MAGIDCVLFLGASEVVGVLGVVCVFLWGRWCIMSSPSKRREMDVMKL